MPLPIIVLGLKVHFTRILLRAVEGGLPRRKIEKREINKEGLWGVPSNSGIAARNFPQIYSGVPNNHTGMLIYFGQKCRRVLLLF